ncbi:MAG: hypothetical protein B0D92_00395 [Spirochaeta sp. LUC14_002_19_P3]|nr:MAG: hypothetical protein B0D92_00395 [Spirochaeta sp. LUC14_002_19_P3]
MPRLRDIGIIAFPMVVSQASETVNYFVDRLFLSHLGKLYIAGALTGGITAIWASSFFVGIFMFVNALVAQHHGAGKHSGCARAAAQAVRLAFMSWPLLLLTIPLVRFLLGTLGHRADQIAIEMSYFSILMYGALFNLLRYALTGFFTGLGRTRIVMLANIAGMLVNIPANWILIFGRLGVPALGMRGAAIGSLCGSAVIMLILMAVYFSKPYRREFNTAGELGFDKSLMKKLLEYGTPAGLEFFLNISAFNLFIQLMHSYSADTAAAVTIALNYDMLAFVPMMGVGFAATTLTGRCMGAGNLKAAERAIRLNLYTAWSYAAIFVLLFSFGAGPLVNVFAERLEGGGAAVAAMAKTMLRLAAVYVLADATQVIFAGALRGAGDTKFVMRMSVILHWAFVGIIFYTVKIAALPALTSWYVFIGFALLLGVAMFLRYRFGKWRELSLVD